MAPKVFVELFNSEIDVMVPKVFVKLSETVPVSVSVSHFRTLLALEIVAVVCNVFLGVYDKLFKNEVRITIEVGMLNVVVPVADFKVLLVIGSEAALYNPIFAHSTNPAMLELPSNGL